MIRIAIFGAAGRMGRSMVQNLAGLPGLALAAAVEAPGSPFLGRGAGELAGVAAEKGRAGRLDGGGERKLGEVREVLHHAAAHAAGGAEDGDADHFTRPSFFIVAASFSRCSGRSSQSGRR